MTNDETAKRRELQLMLLREGYSQDEARETAAHTDRLDDWLKLMRKNVTGPERQIVPPGTVDLIDLKRQRENAIAEAEEEKYYERRDRLATTMAELFHPSDLPIAALMAMLEVIEANGVDRLEALADIIKHVQFLRDVTAQKQEQTSCTER
jgi:hypothetical protein